jgi:hypothetical protein
MDPNKYTNGLNDSSTSKDSVPWLVIIIALAVGGTITTICVAVIAFVLVKTIKHRGLAGLQKPPDPEEERIGSLIIGGRKFGDSLSNESSISDTNKSTIKVLPAGGASFRNRADIIK